MKANQLIKLIAVAGFSFAALLPVHADFKEDARKVFADNAPSVVSLRGLLKIDISMNGQDAGSQEKRLVSNGVVVSDGLVLVAYRTIKPDLSAQGKKGVSLESSLSEIKIVDESGEEFDGKLVLHDEDLGLAFVALNPKHEKSKKFKVKPIELSKDVEVDVLDELLALGRLPEAMRSVSRISTGRVAAIIKRPRTLYIPKGLPLSNPVFNQKGDFVGFTVALRKSGSTPMLMPAKYIRKMIDQAKVKQAELSK